QTSAAQKRLFILDKIAGRNNINYNMPGALIIEGNLNKNRLEQVFKKLIIRHESLRTSFEILATESTKEYEKNKNIGEIIQVVHDNIDFKINYYDLTKDKNNLATESTEKHGKEFLATKKQEIIVQKIYSKKNNLSVNSVAKKEKEKNSASSAVENKKQINNIIKKFVRPFDLAYAPLLRVELTKLNNEKYLLLFDMHHIISDGVSINILIKEIISFYHGENLPEMRLQYKDFAAWQNRIFKKDNIKIQRAARIILIWRTRIICWHI
ncbi:unnamed protein product, partial [marine sediment metagenome]